MSLKFARIKNKAYLCNRKPQKQGEMAEWSIAAVLKTVEGHTSGGSNPSLSANKSLIIRLLLYLRAKLRTIFWDQMQKPGEVLKRFPLLQRQLNNQGSFLQTGD